MSQRELARRTGLHHSTVSRLLRGAVPTLATVLALQEALDPAPPAAPILDAPELHPAMLSAMLRRDGFLSNDEIDRLVGVYVQFVTARPRRAAGAPRVSVRATGIR